jgi:general secretion pathway protein M
MRAWFEGLEPRERWILIGGGIVAAAIILWWLVLSPLRTGSASLQAAVESKQRLLLDLARLEAMGSAHSPGDVQGTSDTLVVVVDRTSKQHGLPLVRSRANGPSGVDVTFQGVPFDVLVTWLMTLHGSYAVDVESASLNTAREPGLVNGQLSLHRL